MRSRSKIGIFLISAVLFVLGAAWVFLSCYPLRYPELIYEYSHKYDLPPEAVCSVIKTESGFRTEATSRAGAKGLMQLMESTADWAADEVGMEDYSYDKITNPEVNIELGCWLLSSLIKKYDGDFEKALCAYNAGSGNVDRWLSGEESGRLDAIPFSETEAYLCKVKRHMTAYKLILSVIGGKYEV